MIELNPSALKVAALLDLERRYTGKRSELHGIPILLKVRQIVSLYPHVLPLTVTQDNFATIASEGALSSNQNNAGPLLIIFFDQA